MDNIEQLKKFFEQIRDERRMHANTAERIGNAFLSLLSPLKNIVTMGELKETFTLRDNEEKIEKVWEFLKGLRVLEELNAADIKAETITLDKREDAPETGGKTYVQSGGYIKGGKGFGIYKDANGAWCLDIDNIDVRGALGINVLKVNTTEYLGGEVILTVGGSIVATDVEETDGGYKVYFKNSDGDGREICCQMVAGDLAKCQTWNETTGQHFYWLEVVEVGGDYVVLGRLDGDTTEYSAPRAGDEIVHLGNVSDKERQAALIFSARTQSMRIYIRIDTTSLGNAAAPIDLNPVESRILAKFITMSSGVTLDTAFTDVRDRLGVLADDMAEVKSQSDKQFIIWFGDYIPTLTNEPYTDWIADGKDVRDLHVKDVFYNRNTNISQGGGRAFRFEKDPAGNYLWDEITDKDTLLALEKAAKAQDTADNKRRIFVELPVPPYDPGDSWVNATYSDGEVTYDNDMLVVKRDCGKIAGEEFDINDWQPATKATSAYLAQLADQILSFVTDTNNSIKEIQGKLKTAQETATKAVEDAAKGMKLANAAQEAADNNTAALQVTSKNITALVEGGYLNDDGTLAKSVQSIIDVADNHIAALSQKLAFDSEGNVTNIDKSGLVLTTDFATLFLENMSSKKFVNQEELDSVKSSTEDAMKKATEAAGVAAGAKKDADAYHTEFTAFKDAVTIFTQSIKWDGQGHITNIDTSGLVLEEHFAGLFTEQVNDQKIATSASVATAIEDGIAKAIIKAEQIQMSGKTIINDYFAVDASGNLTIGAKDTERTLTVHGSGTFTGELNATSGVFENCTIKETCEITRISATSGTIAGFKIEGNGLTNDPWTNDAYIIFRNDAHKCFAGIGGNVLAASSGNRAVARFENDDEGDQWGLGANYAMILSARNGTRNYAFAGTGNGVLNGWIGGYAYQKVTLTTADTIMGGALSLYQSNQFIIYSSAAFGGVELPRLTHVRSALACGTATNFAVTITITIDALSNNAYIYGRNKLEDSSKATPWNTAELPVILDWTGGVWDRKYMAAGDFITFMLIYDGTKTGTLGGFDLKYSARVVNLIE